GFPVPCTGLARCCVRRVAWRSSAGGSSPCCARSCPPPPGRRGCRIGGVGFVTSLAGGGWGAGGRRAVLGGARAGWAVRAGGGAGSAYEVVERRVGAGLAIAVTVVVLSFAAVWAWRRRHTLLARGGDPPQSRVASGGEDCERTAPVNAEPD